MADARLLDRILGSVRGGNVFELTVEHLASAVRLGVFADGEKLPSERDLAARLGVSRVTLRDAIAALRESGLVVTHPGRGGGTIVTYDATVQQTDTVGEIDLGAAGLRDSLDFRRVVEPGAAYLAAGRNKSDEECSWLRSLEREVRAADDDRHAHRIADARLHLAIASLCGSPTLIEAVTRTQESLRLLLLRMGVFHRNICHSHEQHRVIVEAVVAGDQALARSTMEEHCDGTSALLRALVSNEKGES